MLKCVETIVVHDDDHDNNDEHFAKEKRTEIKLKNQKLKQILLYVLSKCLEGILCHFHPQSLFQSAVFWGNILWRIILLYIICQTIKCVR